MTTWAAAVVPDGADAGSTGAAAAADDCAGVVAYEDDVRGSSVHSLLSM